MDQLVGEWKRSELLREATDAELASVKEQLRFVPRPAHYSFLADASRPQEQATVRTERHLALSNALALCDAYDDYEGRLDEDEGGDGALEGEESGIGGEGVGTRRVM